jgi:hypothetical protein
LREKAVEQTQIDLIYKVAEMALEQNSYLGMIVEQLKVVESIY